MSAKHVSSDLYCVGLFRKMSVCAVKEQTEKVLD